MRTYSVAVLTAALLAGPAGAKLPPLSDDAKAKAAETAAKAAWTDKVGLYQLCKSMDRVADAYRKSPKAAGKDSPPGPTATPCVDPGPFATPVTPAASKPLEASGAHSPSGTATSPPSNNATSAQMQGGVKK
jgi:hypothetical protein